MGTALLFNLSEVSLFANDVRPFSTDVHLGDIEVGWREALLDNESLVETSLPLDGTSPDGEQTPPETSELRVPSSGELPAK